MGGSSRGGQFFSLAGLTRPYLGRLNSDGTLDGGFNPSPNSTVNAVAIQADGKVLLAGEFTVVAGQSRNRLARLHPDGSLDAGFDPGPNGPVYTLALQADGAILAGGGFSSLAGLSRGSLGRLQADGSADLTFNPGANSTVYAIGVGGNGRVLVGGLFGSLAGQSRTYLGRLNNTGPATGALTRDGGTVTWLRGGTGPELARAEFEHSADGVSWTSLGAGTRVAGGWQRTGATIPAGGSVRGRGRAVGAYFGGSSWLTESYLGAPAWVRQPAGRTNDAGTTATFTVLVRGDAPVVYQWRRNGVALSDGGNVAGATAATLRLSNVLGLDEGAYSVVVSNGARNRHQRGRDPPGSRTGDHGSAREPEPGGRAERNPDRDGVGHSESRLPMVSRRRRLGGPPGRLPDAEQPPNHRRRRVHGRRFQRVRIDHQSPGPCCRSMPSPSRPASRSFPTTGCGPWRCRRMVEFSSAGASPRWAGRLAVTWGD
jgi:uncharacterized delta-60 repeat protein